MKKKLLALLLATVATTALAEFTPIYQVNNGNILLIDRSTIKPVNNGTLNWFNGKKGNRQVWEMINTNDPYAPFKSAKSLVEINCDTRQTNLISFTSFSGINGSGSIISSSKPKPEWDYAMPDTAGAALVDAVCK